jgi:hypothetical protein
MLLRRNRTRFEDEFNKEYRAIMSRLPAEVMVGKQGDDMNECKKRKYLDEIYHYLDFCNGQVFLRKSGRISNGTWKYWCEGIRGNMEKPMFAWAWKKIRRGNKSEFTELRELIFFDYKDPKLFWPCRFVHGVRIAIMLFCQRIARVYKQVKQLLQKKGSRSTVLIKNRM